MSQSTLEYSRTRGRRTIKKAYYIVIEDELSGVEFLKLLAQKKVNSPIEILNIGTTPMCSAERLDKMFNEYVDLNNKTFMEGDEKAYILDFDILETPGHYKNIKEYVNNNYVIYYNLPNFEYYILLNSIQNFSELDNIPKEKIDELAKSKNLFKGKNLTDEAITLLNTSMFEKANEIKAFVKKEFHLVTVDNVEEIKLDSKNKTNLFMLINKIENE